MVTDGGTSGKGVILREKRSRKYIYIYISFFIYYLYSQFVQFRHFVEFFNSYINM